MKEWEDQFTPRSSVLHVPPDPGEVQLRKVAGLLRVMLVVARWPMRDPAASSGGEVATRRVGAVADHPPASQFPRPRPPYNSLHILNLAYGEVTATDVFLGTPTLWWPLTAARS
jgi:hypothetical protein